MKSRLPLVLSAVALVVAIVGTPVSEGALRVVRTALFAKNAGAVNGIKASRSPRSGRLLALGANAKLPRSVIPAVDAASVDGFKASSSPLPGSLLPLGPNSALDTSVIPKIAARVWSDTAQPVPLSAPGPGTPETGVRFDRVAFDTDRLFDAATPDRLRIPVAGIYLITGSVFWAPAPSDVDLGDRVIRIIADTATGGHQVAVTQTVPPSGPAQSVTGLYALAPGDDVRLQVGASANTTLVPDGTDLPSLAVIWLAPAP
jgi:hypothetical protein